jgi:hypothetical protein
MKKRIIQYCYKKFFQKQQLMFLERLIIKLNKSILLNNPIVIVYDKNKTIQLKKEQYSNQKGIYYSTIINVKGSSYNGELNFVDIQELIIELHTNYYNKCLCCN